MELGVGDFSEPEYLRGGILIVLPLRYSVEIYRYLSHACVTNKMTPERIQYYQ